MTSIDNFASPWVVYDSVTGAIKGRGNFTLRDALKQPKSDKGELLLYGEQVAGANDKYDYVDVVTKELKKRPIVSSLVADNVVLPVGAEILIASNLPPGTKVRINDDEFTVDDGTLELIPAIDNTVFIVYVVPPFPWLGFNLYIKSEVL